VNKPKGEIWLVVRKVVPVNSEYFRIINICTVMLIKAAVRVILATQCQISDFIPIMNDVKLKRI